MFKKIIFSLMGFLAIILILFSLPISTRAQIYRPSCCDLKYDIDLEDVSVKERGFGGNRLCNGCTAEYEAIDRRNTYTFQENWIVGDIDDDNDNNIIDFAGGEDDCYLGSSPYDITVSTPTWGMVCLVNSIYNVTDIVFWFALSLSVIVGIITGFFFFTAGGEPYKIEKAKAMLIWLVVGIAVAVSAKLITALIMAIVL